MPRPYVRSAQTPAKRYHVSLIAMGRTPPPGFSSPIKSPSRRKASRGSSPDRMRLSSSRVTSRADVTPQCTSRPQPPPTQAPPLPPQLPPLLSTLRPLQGPLLKRQQPPLSRPRPPGSPALPSPPRPPCRVLQKAMLLHSSSPRPPGTTLSGVTCWQCSPAVLLWQTYV